MIKQLVIGAAVGVLLSSACGRAGSSAERAPDVAPRSARTESPPPAESSSLPVASPDSPPPSDGKRTTLTVEALRAYEARSPTIKDRRVGAPPFDTFTFDKVVAYDFESDSDSGAAIIEDGKFAARVYKQHALTQEQADRLLGMLAANTTYGGSPAACFEPHLGLVFYEDHEEVGHVSVCLACNRLDSSMDIPAMSKMYEPVYRIGFSDSARSKLAGFCRELGFSHCKALGEGSDAE
jgi:hypothetical protein